jgi:hypothetical protein
MKNVLFELAGFQNLKHDVFLQSRHRKYKENTTIFHNNDKHTVLKMPYSFFKDNFKYCSKTGTYKNNLTWFDLIGFFEVLDLKHQ